LDPNIFLRCIDANTNANTNKLNTKFLKPHCTESARNADKMLTVSGRTPISKVRFWFTFKNYSISYTVKVWWSY